MAPSDKEEGELETLSMENTINDPGAVSIDSGLCSGLHRLLTIQY